MDNEIKYRTVEGHEIVRDGVYETRGGKKATVLGFIPSEEYAFPILGYVALESTNWYSNGFYTNFQEHKLDLMRPWKEKTKPDDHIPDTMKMVDEPKKLPLLRVIYKAYSKDVAEECVTFLNFPFPATEQNISELEEHIKEITLDDCIVIKDFRRMEE